MKGWDVSALSIGTTTADTDSQGSSVSDGPDSGPGAKFVKWIPGDALTFYAGILSLEAAGDDSVPSVQPLTDTAVPGVVESSNQLGDQLRDINESSFAWFAFALFAAAVLVIAGANTKQKRGRRTRAQLSVNRRLLILRCILAAAAFTIWASLIPKAWPNKLTFVQDMGAAYPLVVTIVGIVFTFVAEYATKKVQK